MFFKRNLFLIIFTTATLISTFAPWGIRLINTPKDMIFSGNHWWSPDYFVYLSFVEIGERGQLKEQFLYNPLALQKDIWVHGIYTFSGYLGRMLGLDSITVYHLDRIILAGLFIISLYFLYRAAFKDKLTTAVSLFFCFWIAGFPPSFRFWDPTLSNPLNWLQQANILTRVATLPHYLFSYIFFVPAVIFFIRLKNSILKIGILILLTWLLTIANPINIVIYQAALGLYLFLRLTRLVTLSGIKKIILEKEFLRELTVYFTVLTVDLPLIYYYYTILSSYPWGPVSNALKFYIGSNVITTFELLLTLGPLTIFSALGGVIAFIEIFQKESQETKFLLLFISWTIIQSILFYQGQRIGIDQYRVLQGLYFIPMAGLAAYSLRYLSRLLLRITERVHFFKLNVQAITIILTAGLVAYTFPTLYLSLRQHLYAYNDKFSYLTLAQYQAYKFMEKNTSLGSSVLAGDKASKLLQGLAGNAITLQGIGYSTVNKYEFFLNKLEADEAYRYFKMYDYQYILVGDEERAMGFKPENYSYLIPFFDNGEIAVYRIQ